MHTFSLNIKFICRNARIAEYFSSVSYRVQLNLLYRHKVYSSCNSNQCLSPLTLWVRILLIARCTRYNITCDKVCQWLVTGRWFSPGTPVSFTNKTNRHDNWNIVERGVKHHRPNPDRTIAGYYNMIIVLILIFLYDWVKMAR